MSTVKSADTGALLAVLAAPGRSPEIPKRPMPTGG